jgi:hypothetical protein
MSAFVAITLIASGCDQVFDPRGPYQKRLVVYSVLSNRSDSQYVRIYTTYNPSGFDPLESSTDTYVRNAKVTVTDDSTTYTLKETFIPRDDRSRYASDLIAYSAFPCRLRPGKQWSLTIASDQGDAAAQVVVPAHGTVYNNTPYIFVDPRKHPEDIPVSIGLSSTTQAFLIRFYINADVQVGQTILHQRFEVPMSGDTTGITQQFKYPTLTHRPTSPYFNVVYPHRMYLALIKNIENQYGGFSLKNAVFILTQVESNLYNYYNLANGFRDAYSIREDQPDFSNIKGGFGVFGAMVEDSLVVDLR